MIFATQTAQLSPEGRLVLDLPPSRAASGSHKDTTCPGSFCLSIRATFTGSFHRVWHFSGPGQVSGGMKWGGPWPGGQVPKMYPPTWLGSHSTGRTASRAVQTPLRGSG